ncbi:MAG TPA: hypothetical protein VES97_02910, partial [Solirubrobacteraceae bacterium]|nr:hypothetical protein [Solirubrobacteraceae bacterium]
LGALLALLGLGAALLAAARALRGADPLARSVTAAALGGFAYWAVHGSVDWLWEFAGLGAPAFAMLGLACALAPGPERASGSTQPPRRRTGSRPLIAASGLGALAIAASLAAPWLSRLQVQSAARIWTRAPQTAYAHLSDAARLNPLSDEAYLVAGSIALRYGELARADHEFSLALARTPGDAYATLERGAIASARGERSAALGLLERAVQLDPRDMVARQALSLVRGARRVGIEELNRLILLKAEQLS